MNEQSAVKEALIEIEVVGDVEEECDETSSDTVAVETDGASVVCRICLDSEHDANSPLISPCKCAGSQGYVHEACLVHWIDTTSNQAAKTRCQLCNTHYAMRRVRKRRACSLKLVRDQFVFCVMENVLGFFAVLVVSFCMLLSYFIHTYMCKNSLEFEEVVLCDTALIFEAGSVYLLGSIVCTFLFVLHSVYFFVLRGASQWCMAVCSQNRTPLITLLIMLCLILSYVYSNVILQATALYLIDISAMHKLIWALNGNDYERLRIEQNAYTTQLYNYEG
jgi:hypothetical protein